MFFFCLSVCPLDSTKNYKQILVNFCKSWAWPKEQLIRFWSLFRSRAGSRVPVLNPDLGIFKGFFICICFPRYMKSEWHGTDEYFVAVMPGCMQLEVEMAVPVCAQWSAMTRTPTNGCCVHRWQSGVVALVSLHAMDSCMLSVAMMLLPATQHQVVLIVLNGM